MAGIQARSVEESAGTTARRRLILIFCIALAAGLVIAVTALREMGGTSRKVDEALTEHAENLLQVERLGLLSERLGRVARSFLLSGDPDFIAELTRTRQQFAATAERLSAALETEEARHLLELARQGEDEYQQATDRAIALRSRSSPALEAIGRLETEVRTTRERLDVALASLANGERHDFDHARAEATLGARSSFRVLAVATVAALVLAVALAWALARTLAGLSRSRSELDASLDRLERANRDLDAFAGRIAHDLRNILAPLPLTAGRLRHHGHDPAVVEGSADKIERVARRADGLMEALLAFARAGQPPDTGAAAPVGKAVQEALDDLGQLRSLVDAEVKVDLDGEHLEVQCAPSLLYTVMANLLSNALKFVEGRPRREIRIRARRDDGLGEISVSDSGPGIPEESQRRIFEPFYRAPDAKGPGTGIGLATVQRIVLAYGGRLTVRSRPGDGATFVVRLPLAERSVLPSVAAGAPEEPALH
jgi:two-component system OmpR family sensor kinase